MSAVVPEYSAVVLALASASLFTLPLQGRVKKEDGLFEN
jgi:hypothetical protein